jgi:hypothetical protein
MVDSDRNTVCVDSLKYAYLMYKGDRQTKRVERRKLQPPSINHTDHPSNQSATSPPKTDNQTPSCPVFDSPRYAPRTSTIQTPSDSPALADFVHSDAPSKSGNHPHIPSKDIASRRTLRTLAYWPGDLCLLSPGMWLPLSAAVSMWSGLVVQRLGGSRRAFHLVRALQLRRALGLRWLSLRGWRGLRL